jgi:hypothetical protein
MTGFPVKILPYHLFSITYGDFLTGFPVKMGETE